MLYDQQRESKCSLNIHGMLLLLYNIRMLYNNKLDVYVYLKYPMEYLMF
jgi:hypothetical protein